MPNLTIRKVQPEDNLALAKLIRNIFEEFNAPKNNTVYSDESTDKLYELFENKKAVLWVALCDEFIVGCCGIYPTKGLPEHCAELVKFYLKPHYRGMGIGKKMMIKSFEFARNEGYTSLYLESFPEFEQAVDMYKKYGFVELEKPMGESGHTACNIWMLKYL